MQGAYGGPTWTSKSGCSEPTSSHKREQRLATSNDKGSSDNCGGRSRASNDHYFGNN
jgi:hypothetical protein